MSLFTDILIHPDKSAALENVRFLASTSDVMRRIPLNNPSSKEVEYVQQMIGFVTELSRLGHCAIEKAQA